MAGKIEKIVGKHGVYYRARVDLGKKLNGKRNQKTTTGKMYKAVERQQRDLLHQADQGQFVVMQTKMALKEYPDDYLSTIKNKGSIFTRFTTWPLTHSKNIQGIR